MPPLRVFLSYAHEDESGRERLEKHLAPLRRTGLVELWADIGIRAGQDWNEEIEQHLRASDVIVFLLSADWVDSDFCYRELEIALEQERCHRAVIVPVLLKAVIWKKTPFARHQVLPRNGVPIENQESPEQAFAKVIEDLLETFVAFLPPAGLEDVRSSLSAPESEPARPLSSSGEVDFPALDLVGSLYRLGIEALEKGKPLVAIDWLRRALTLAEDDPRSEPGVLTDCRRSLAEAHRLSGDLETAQNFAGLATDSARTSGSPIVLIACLNESALVLMSREDWEAAKVRLLEALTVGALSGCDNTRELAVANHNLALVFAHLGVHERAEKYLHRAIAIDERHFPAHHPEIALDRNTLGLIFQAQGRLRAARQQFKRAYKDLAAALGMDHPHTAAAQKNLAGAALSWLPLFR
jgi:tetratricopeptide (TPR) repeat protein